MRPDLEGAFLYYDAQMYAPERLALECLIDADAHGAAIANYVEAETLSAPRWTHCGLRGARSRNWRALRHQGARNGL